MTSELTDRVNGLGDATWQRACAAAYAFACASAERGTA